MKLGLCLVQSILSLQWISAPVEVTNWMLSTLCSAAGWADKIQFSSSITVSEDSEHAQSEPYGLCLDPKFGSKLQSFSTTSTCHTHTTFQSHHLQFQPKSKLCAELNTAMVSDQRCSSLTWLSITLQHKLAAVFRSMKLEGTNFGHIQKKMHENKYSCKQLIWYTPIFDEKTSYIYNGTASKSLCRVPSFHH